MSSSQEYPQVQINETASRFETTVENSTAFLEFKRMGDTIDLTHTIVPPAIEGHGVGSALAEFALSYARTNSLCVIPTCAFVAAYVESHPEYADLVA